MFGTIRMEVGWVRENFLVFEKESHTLDNYSLYHCYVNPYTTIGRAVSAKTCFSNSKKDVGGVVLKSYLRRWWLFNF